MRATDAETQWVKLGKKENMSFIGKDILLYSRGCFIKGINLKTLEEHFLAVNFHSQNGDGVKCLRGHRTLSVFAYAENCQYASLIIMAYPSFQVISKFDCFHDTNDKITVKTVNDEVSSLTQRHFDISGVYQGYSCITFSEASLLFTLGNRSNNIISVWNWRAEEKFCEQYNAMVGEHQLIRCSWGKPMYLAQMSLESPTLWIWDVFTVCKKTIFSQHLVKLGNETPAVFSDMVWTTDGGLFIIDQIGEIFTVGRDFTLEKVANWDMPGDLHTSICLFKSGLLASGPTRLIRHYKKAGSWICDWQYEVDVNFKQVLSNRGDVFIGLTDSFEIVLLGASPDTMTYLRQYQSDFNDIGLVYPEGKYLVAVCQRKMLNVFDVATGNVVNTYPFAHEALIVSENPEFPYVAVGKAMGMVRLLSLYDVNKIILMASFHLSDTAITNIKFFEHGRMMLAGNSIIGEFFVIEGLPGTEMQVITKIQINYQVLDLFLVSSSNCYRIFVLPVTSPHILAGNKFIRYCIISKDNINVKEYFPENKQYYHRIHPTKGQHRDRVFYALPVNSRRIHQMETKRGDDTARVISETVTGHILRQFHFRLTKYHALTYGYDGFIIVRDCNFERLVGMGVAHHRFYGGVKIAYIDPLEQYIIALGQDNALVCLKLPYNPIDPEREMRIQEFRKSSKFALMFKRPTIGFDPQGRFKDKSWVEVERILKFEKEKAICDVERLNLIKEFHSIQEAVQRLVTQNIQGPENENIDLIEFYLDQNMYHNMQQQNKEDCKQTELYLRALIAAQDKVSSYMIKTYWEPMEVPWKAIHGLFGNFQATNYCLLPEASKELQRLSWIEEERKVEQFLSSHDTFEPWVLAPKEKVLALVKKLPRLPKEDYSGMAAQRRLQHLEDAEIDKTQETKVALAGAVSMLHIELSPGHYQQRQLVSFYQCELQQVVAEQEESLKWLFRMRKPRGEDSGENAVLPFFDNISITKQNFGVFYRK